MHVKCLAYCWPGLMHMVGGGLCKVVFSVQDPFGILLKSPITFIINIIITKYFPVLSSCFSSWLGAALFSLFKATFAKLCPFLLLVFFPVFVPPPPCSSYSFYNDFAPECPPRNIIMETTPFPQVEMEPPPLVGKESSWDLRPPLLLPSTWKAVGETIGFWLATRLLFHYGSNPLEQCQSSGESWWHFCWNTPLPL